MAGLIYTANVGGYDKPRPLAFREPGVDYAIFTDGDDVPGWETVRIEANDNPQMTARLIKVTTPLSFKTYDWTLWVDANFEVIGPVAEQCVQWLSKHDFAAMQHPWWQCSYIEIEKCRELGKDNDENLDAAKKYLLEEGFPRDYGQLATGVLLRGQGEFVEEHAKQWWADIATFTRRDQVTFMLNLWRQGVDIEWMFTMPKANEWSNSWLKFQRGHK